MQAATWIINAIFLSCAFQQWSTSLLLALHHHSKKRLWKRVRKILFSSLNCNYVFLRVWSLVRGLLCMALLFLWNNKQLKPSGEKLHDWVFFIVRNERRERAGTSSVVDVDVVWERYKSIRQWKKRLTNRNNLKNKQTGWVIGLFLGLRQIEF